MVRMVRRIFQKMAVGSLREVDILLEAL